MGKKQSGVENLVELAASYSQLRDKRILVTGATGFIGSHLVRRLVSEKARVYALCRRDADTWRIKDCLSDLNVVESDITDKDSLISTVQRIRPQKCFHLAAYGVNQSEINFSQAVQTNINGTLNLLLALKDTGLECVVNFGTSYEYGGTSGAISEDSTVNPNNLYAASKSAAWLFYDYFHKSAGVPIVTIKLFPVYGPFEELGKLIPTTIVKALQKKELLLTSGEQERDYIFIEDVIDGCLSAATIREAVGQTINLGTGKAHPIKVIITRCLALMGDPVEPVFGALPYRKNELFSLYADTRKAEKILGWSPKVGLEEGLRKTIEWYSHNRYLFE